MNKGALSAQVKLNYSTDNILASLCLAIGEHCPRCKESRHYILHDGRRRCPSCGYTYTLFTGRFVNRVRLSSQNWLRMLILFWDGRSVQEAADALGVKYDTAYKAYTTVRLALLCSALGPLNAGAILDDAEGVVDFCPNLKNESEQAMCKDCRSYVFALKGDGNAQAILTLIHNLAARDILTSPINRKPWGTMVYTDRFRDWEALLFSCCRKGRELFLHEPCDRVFPVERQGGFIDVAEPWMIKYRAISPRNYPLYLAEIVFRYNNHACNYAVPLLASNLCHYSPRHND